MSWEAEAAFSPGLIVSFGRLYPLGRTVGSRQCKKRRCEVCANVAETETFSRTVTGETFQINHKLSCDD